MYFYVLLPILGLKIQSIIFTYLYLNESFSKRLRESWMPLTVGPAVHHIPAVNSVGHSSVSVLYCLLAHSHQDMKIKERDKSQQSQPNLNGKKKFKRWLWSCIFALEFICYCERLIRRVLVFYLPVIRTWCARMCSGIA